MREAERKPVVIGFDTSNYRTSVAAVTLDGEILVNHRGETAGKNCEPPCRTLRLRQWRQARNRGTEKTPICRCFRPDIRPGTCWHPH